MMYPLNDEGRGGGAMGKLYWLLEGLKTFLRVNLGYNLIYNPLINTTGEVAAL